MLFKGSQNQRLFLTAELVLLYMWVGYCQFTTIPKKKKKSRIGRDTYIAQHKSGRKNIDDAIS